jgi:hypothetical protein
MKKKILVIIVMMLLIAVAFPVNAQILDQSQQIIGERGWIQGGEWQEFEPVGKLHEYIEVHIGCWYGGSHPITLSVEKPLGTIINSKTLPASAMPLNTDGWVPFDLNVQLQQG